MRISLSKIAVSQAAYHQPPIPEPIEVGPCTLSMTFLGDCH